MDSLIFIPDISGFTSFVGNTEIKHSEHIISELIEIIIDSDETGMQLAEVEGDAVLFFMEEKVPSISQILGQVEKTFLKFHNHLKKYEKYRICSCGACSSAANLNLKFIVHSGELGSINVQGRKKPHGRELVRAHRLMKNNIDSDSYILLSANASKHFELDDQWIPESYEYPDLGMENYFYKDISILLDKLENIPEPLDPERIKNPVIYSVNVSTEIDSLIHFISDFSKREQWQQGVDRLEYDESELHRVGTSHVCIINNRRMNYTTISFELDENRMVLGEKNTSPPLFKEMITYYILESLDYGTSLRVELHFFQKNLLSRMFTPFLKKLLYRNLKASVDSLKEIAESELTNENE